MIIELLKPWRRWDAGFRLEKTAGAADMLIKRGIAKAVDGDATAKPGRKRATKKSAKSIGTPKRSRKKASE